MQHDEDARSKSLFSSLSVMEVEQRFSESRCAKILPIATGTYHEGLPSHYVRSVHEAKLAQALQVFLHNARGPAAHKYALQLREECEKYWTNGRQLCEHISLTGQHCVNELHRLPDDLVTDENNELPTMPHSSRSKNLCACNCGKMQANRDDPFDIKAANFDFYKNLETNCCGELEHFEFPVFEATSEQVAPANVQLEPSTGKFSKTDEETQGSMSLGTNLSQSVGDEEKEEVLQKALEDLTVKDEDKEVTSQISTTEYLDGMLHSESPQGLLPRFLHWSLVCLGPASLYNPNSGLDFPGFLHGSNYLLPWEIQPKVQQQESTEKWPSIGESSGKKGQHRTKKSVKDAELQPCTAYVGVEFECPRGHRFFCSGPDKMLKIPSNSVVKDNATKLLSLDMPLYFPCPCRSSKSLKAQMMRIYVVVPKHPVTITLEPKVVPAPVPCPVFFPGCKEPITLGNNKFWIMRLPYIYLGDQGPYYAPTDSVSVSSGHLVKGLLKVV